MYRYNKDYLIRQNELLAKAMGRILSFKQNEELSEVIKFIDDFLLEHGLFIESDFDCFSTFDKIIVNERILTDNELEIVGTLYLEKGELLLLLNIDRKEGLKHIRFSRSIFTRLIKANPKMYFISWENSLKKCQKLEDEYS